MYLGLMKGVRVLSQGRIAKNFPRLGAPGASCSLGVSLTLPFHQARLRPCRALNRAFDA